MSEPLPALWVTAHAWRSSVYHSSESLAKTRTHTWHCRAFRPGFSVGDWFDGCDTKVETRMPHIVCVCVEEMHFIDDTFVFFVSNENGWHSSFLKCSQTGVILNVFTEGNKYWIKQNWWALASLTVELGATNFKTPLNRALELCIALRMTDHASP